MTATFLWLSFRSFASDGTREEDVRRLAPFELLFAPSSLTGNRGVYGGVLSVASVTTLSFSRFCLLGCFGLFFRCPFELASGCTDSTVWTSFSDLDSTEIVGWTFRLPCESIAWDEAAWPLVRSKP